MKIKALSLYQPYASLIWLGRKTIETRTYKTNERGDILICSTKYPDKVPCVKCDGIGCPHCNFRHYCPTGVGLVIVNLFGCRSMRKGDEEDAQCEYDSLRWSWLLKDIRPLKRPFSVRGHQGFYAVEIPHACLP